MIIGTAGHIDHGKTSLVKALTGTDADRLKEEKERGITLDLGFAYTPLPNGDVLGFIDVPGHEKLVHNMLAGATGIDFVLLVVAADDGLMPQTLEHLQIIDLLGLNRGAVALTKIGLASLERVDEVTAQITVQLANTGLAGSPIFPVDSISGEGVASLWDYLQTQAQALGIRPSQGGFRLAVDRSFTLKGIGTVVTGTVFSGRVETNQSLLVWPGNIEVRVRGIHAQNQPAQQGLTGQRCALNLVGVEKQQIERGAWVLSPVLATPSNRIDVELRLLDDAPPLKHWSAVHIHLAATHVTGRVALLEGELLQPGQTMLAQLVPDRPICATHFDRFILRDASAVQTLAGGRVLDIHALLRYRRSPQRLAMLEAWRCKDETAWFGRLLALSGNGLNLDEFAVNANLLSEQLEALTRQVPCVLAASRSPATAFSPEHWQRLCDTAIDAMARAHTESEDALGLNAEQLRMRTAPQVTRAAFADLIAALLIEGRLAKDGSWLHLPDHQIRLNAEDEKLWQEVRPLLETAPFQPPRVRDIGNVLGIPEATVRNLMRRLARKGMVYLVAHDHYYLPQAVSALAEIVRQTADAHPKAEVCAADFRTRIDTGRKLAIHILEFFDRMGYTRRVNDAHRIRNELIGF
jgi:selenocysteine-specific elongation factor